MISEAFLDVLLAYTTVGWRVPRYELYSRVPVYSSFLLIISFSTFCVKLGDFYSVSSKFHDTDAATGMMTLKAMTRLE